MIYTQLASFTPSTHPRPLPPFAKVTAISLADARCASSFLKISLDQITITGSPLLDDLPSKVTAPKNVQCLTLVESEVPIEERLLKEFVYLLIDRSFSVRICPHPREDPQSLVRI